MHDCLRNMHVSRTPCGFRLHLMSFLGHSHISNTPAFAQLHCSVKRIDLHTPRSYFHLFSHFRFHEGFLISTIVG